MVKKQPGLQLNNAYQIRAYLLHRGVTILVGSRNVSFSNLPQLVVNQPLVTDKMFNRMGITGNSTKKCKRYINITIRVKLTGDCKSTYSQ